MRGNLYSIILDYRGGTYIDQVIATSPRRAVTEWADTVSDENVRSRMIDRCQLQKLVHDDELVPLSDRINIWCLSGEMGDKLALINVVKTVTTQDQ